ncbi:hypothetical protein D3C80_1635670 [compost metagenome]
MGRQLVHVLHGQGGAHFEHDGRVPQLADRREILARIEAHLLVDVRIQRVGRDRAHAHGVAVRRRLGDHVHADVAARARAVFDDHRLAQRLRHACTHRARHEVGRSARGIGHDETDRLGRKSLLRGQRAGGQAQQCRSGAQHAAARWVRKGGGG